MLRVYNTLTNQKEPFEPLVAGKVGIYLCGPTVYKPPHIGHLVGPVIFDAIKRYLAHKGFAVTWVLNITDVDDKLINEANARGMAMKDLALEQEGRYLKVLEQLGVRESIDVLPRASEHMSEIIAMTQKLIDGGHAYESSGDVWFNVGSDDDYGKLANRRVDQNEAGLRDLQGSGKKNAADFALWKSAKPGEPSWPSPWGEGRPGWHIECSAMSAKYLGETFDIHGGGDDLKFPHHENELAQSECCFGKPFVKYWLHNGLTKIRTKSASGQWRDEKMSKSLGNTVDAADLLAKHGPDVLRYLLLSTHYRSPIEFSDEALATCKKAFEGLYRLIEQRKTVSAAGEPSPAVAEQITAHCEAFFAAMDDDFNTGGAVGFIHKLASLARSNDKQPADFAAATDAIESLLRLLGFPLLPPAAEDNGELHATLSTFASQFAIEPNGDTDTLVRSFIDRRAAAKKAKDFAAADAIRNGLKERGVLLEDRSDGTSWKRA